MVYYYLIQQAQHTHATTKTAAIYMMAVAMLGPEQGADVSKQIRREWRLYRASDPAS